MNFIKTIYLSNISEDVWPFIASLKPKVAKREIMENGYLSDRAVLTLPSNSLFISPNKASPKFLKYVSLLVGHIEVESCVPAKIKGQLSLDILNDAKLINKICSYGSVNLVPYSATKEFYKLVDTLKKKGVKVFLPLSPDPKHGGVVENFGSKSGIRRLIPNYMPPGKIFNNLAEAKDFAKKVMATGGGVVFKTNRGHAGMGVVIIPPKTTFKKALFKDNYWNLFPIVVEEFIKTDTSVGGGFPNLEYQILADGQPKLLYSCGMFVTKEGVFQGIEIGKKTIPKKQLLLMLKIGNKIGKLYSQSGYKGNFDIDFAADKNGKIYVAESNIRQTGGTHVYNLCKNLLGTDFEKKYYVMSNNSYQLPISNWTFDKILSLFKSLLYNHKTKSGVIITSENLLYLNMLSYVAIGHNKAETMSLIETMKKLILFGL